MNKAWANLILWAVGGILTIHGSVQLFGPKATWFTVGCLTIAYASIHGIIYGLVSSRILSLKLEGRRKNHF